MKKYYAIFCVIAAMMLIFSGCSSINDEVSADIDRIGIIGAMDVEVTALKESADIKETTDIAGMEFCEGTLGNKNIVIVKCGMGKVNAGICANTLINDFNCNKIINTGVAGSLDNDIDIGDIVVSVDAVQHDFDVVEGPMADDTIWDYVEDFVAGSITREAFWVLVKFKHPTHQLVFCTARALQALSFVNSYTL